MFARIGAVVDKDESKDRRSGGPSSKLASRIVSETEHEMHGFQS